MSRTKDEIVTLADALNGWLQQHWPTLFAGSFPSPGETSVFDRSTMIYRKGSNNAVLYINENRWVVHGFGDHFKGEIKIVSPADPTFLDEINDCLIRCCKGKDLR